MTVVVDPYLLAIPTGENVTADSIRSYVARLAGWDRVFRTDPDYVVSSAVMSKMYLLNLHPDHHNLAILFDKHHIEEYSAFDVAESCKTVIENYPQMEGKAAADGIVCKKENQRIIPEKIKNRMHPSIAEVFCEALISTSYALDLLGEEDGWTLATAPIEESYTTILASGHIQDSITLVFIERYWPLLFKPSEFIELAENQEEILRIFAKSPDEALKMSWTKIKKSYPNIKTIDQYIIRFNSQFVDSINDKVIKKRPHYKKDLERVFDGIVNSLSDLWKYPGDKHHPLREKIMDRTSEQQIRRNGKCIDHGGRIEVFGGKTPLHIHYWRCEDGTYEISNVTNDHSDPTIY